MLVRPVDDQGDMMPISHPKQMLTGKKAVLQAAQSRLKLLQGEWWENPEAGFSVPSFLFDGVRTPNGPTMLTHYITAYIAQTPGVVSVIRPEGNYIGKKLWYSCTLLTEDGEIEGSVSERVLLPALS